MKTLSITILLLLALFSAWGIACPSATWRYKVTVTVETPEGLKSGSAVREVRVTRQPDFLPDISSAKVSFRGEAAMVNLGDHGVIFAAMGANDYNIVFATFPSGEPALTDAGIRYYRDLRAGPKEITPYLVFLFENTNAPETAKLLSNDVGNSLRHTRPNSTSGGGVKLHSMTIEMTEDPLSSQLFEMKLPWLAGSPENRIAPPIGSSDYSAEAQLRQGSFLR